MNLGIKFHQSSLTLLSLLMFSFNTHDNHSQYCPSITLQNLLCPISFLLCPSSSLSLKYKPLKSPSSTTWLWGGGPRHSAPRSWHERDFCLMNLPTSRSRWYRGTRLDRKRLAREVMLSRWPPPHMSSALVPGGHGGWPLASRTAHSRSSDVRWSREAEISR